MPSIAKKSETLIYHVAFEDYLQPKKQLKLPKQAKAQFGRKTNKKCKPEMRLKLLEHPVLVAGRPSKFQKYKKRLQEKFKRNNSKSNVMQVVPVEKVEVENISNDKTIQIGRRWQPQTRLANSQPQCSKISELFKLPSFLAFLRARNDDGLCKRKSGFEIYCEMSSIHGFINFVGAKTWQRVFWCLIIAFAMIMSTIFLSMWHFMNVDTPVIMYTESIHHPAWTIPFPAITICNLNRVSRRRSEELVEKFLPNTNLSRHEMLQLFVLPLYSAVELESSPQNFLALQELLKQNNYTLTQFQNEISPNCASEILRCKWKGRNERCDELFRRVETPQGYCCAFNYHGWTREEIKSQNQQSSLSHDPYQITSCGYKTGLTVLLEPNIDDYMASLTLTPGYQVLIHDAHDYPADSVERQYVWLRTETSVSITPQNTYATSYMSSLGADIRRCYLPNERKLISFENYTQTNCLAECRSQMISEKCGCVPLYWPRVNGTAECSLEKAACILKYKAIHYALLKNNTHQRHKIDSIADNFICDCYPECSFNKYTSSQDAATLNRSFALGNKRFFKGIVVKNHILLHAFYGDLIALQFRLDIYENWLSFVDNLGQFSDEQDERFHQENATIEKRFDGTFGGVAGLYMGYSFVSGFEMIFFSLVRPLCNWLTRKQIHYRIKRKQKKAAAAAAAKKALDEKRLASERAANEATNAANNDVKV